MCGRVTLTLDKETVMDLLDLRYDVRSAPLEGHVPRYNISPGQDLLAVLYDRHSHSNRAGWLHWGFEGSWAPRGRSPKAYSNARSEDILQRSTFRESFLNRRCLLLADGYYEWQSNTGFRQPYYVHPPGRELLALAGIWTSTQKEDGRKSYSCAVLTTGSTGMLKSIHDRMPVVLPPEKEAFWLQSSPEAMLQVPPDFFTSYPQEFLKMHPVSTLVNHVAYDSVDCIKEV
ncbi:SOS response-associated peptidase [Anaerotalea alkaliphila]|uniref:Abasic site processing protein n=1 Tax=Anaerotalea alkaliphila TaxID=2662126 RepID=A0A7X5HXV8_9FIRM|nr:SOS response-associated peptidase [Anaerotalea alkaliphila]NDL68667.1 SOS response-associated peptidase [Anaerotalea alkaliphila]